MSGARLHEARFVRARIPTYLERSLQLALAGSHAPFFTSREPGIVIATLREDEWDRIAGRFAAAMAERGFRLVSLDVRPDDPTFTARLTAALAAAGLRAIPLPSFHRDHVLVREAEAERCLAAVQQFLDEQPEPSAES